MYLIAYLILDEMYDGYDVFVAEKHLKRGSLAFKLLQVLRVSQEEAIVIAIWYNLENTVNLLNKIWVVIITVNLEKGCV